MPFTDLSRSRGIQFRPLSKIAFYIFVSNFLILMVLGAKHVESPFIEFGQISTIIYFSHFLIIVPIVSLLENSLIDLGTSENSDVGSIPTMYRSISRLSKGQPSSGQIRGFSTTRALFMEAGEDPTERPLPEGAERVDYLHIKLVELLGHKQNIVCTHDELRYVKASGDFSEKFRLVKTLIDGQAKYANVGIPTSATIDGVMDQLMEDQLKSKVQVQKDLDLYESKLHALNKNN
jgi:ubiquinol-cytochrome c reductase cytochrome b subunit